VSFLFLRREEGYLRGGKKKRQRVIKTREIPLGEPTNPRTQNRNGIRAQCTQPEVS